MTTYRAFWPHYIQEHQDARNRRLHFLGSVLVLAFLGLAFATESVWWLMGMPLAGYGFSWAGHFFYEKNQPLSFRYPVWSFLADWQMFFLMCVGRMSRELSRMAVLHSDYQSMPFR